MLKFKGKSCDALCMQTKIAGIISTACIVFAKSSEKSYSLIMVPQRISDGHWTLLQNKCNIMSQHIRQ